MPGGSIVLRRRNTYFRNVLIAVSGGLAPQTMSIKWSAGTTEFACITNAAIASLGFTPPSATAWPSTSTSKGPRT